MKKLFWGTIASFHFIFTSVFASPIKGDETVVFFPGYASRIDADHWDLHISGWIFETEQRPGVAAGFRKVIGLDEDRMTDAEKTIFAARTRLFLVDAEGGKQISIHLGGRTYELSPSDKNGHFSTRVKVSHRELVREAGNVVSFQAIMREDDSRRFRGTVQLIEPEGISVVSDIDDTIKVSDVLDRKKLLHNTFLKDFVPAPGMANLYHSWSTNGSVTFHYLSASPSQLLEPLEAFRTAHKFPLGIFHLRSFDWRKELHHSVPKKHKPAVLEQLFSEFPQRKFLLVGDSGESDPEIYADITRKFPNQVIGILIRNVTRESADAPRYRKTFSGIKPELWQVFNEPGALKAVTLK